MKAFKISGNKFLSDYPKYNVPIVADSEEAIVEELKKDGCIGQFNIELYNTDNLNVGDNILLVE